MNDQWLRLSMAMSLPFGRIISNHKLNLTNGRTQFRFLVLQFLGFRLTTSCFNHTESILIRNHGIMDPCSHFRGLPHLFAMRTSNVFQTSGPTMMMQSIATTMGLPSSAWPSKLSSAQTIHCRRSNPTPSYPSKSYSQNNPMQKV